MSLSIVEFLNARYDEDEAVANEVYDRFGPSDHPDDYQLHVLDDDYKNNRIGVQKDRVLREVGIKRRVLARHQPHRIVILDVDGDDLPFIECAYDGDEWPCLDLKDYVSLHSTHPDYDPEWAVSE